MRGTSIENVLFIKTFMSLTRGRNAAASLSRRGHAPAASLSCAVTRGKAADAGNPNRKRFACQNVRESVAGQKRRGVIVQRGHAPAASLSCAVTRGKAADAGNPNRKRFACQNVRESVAGQKRRGVIVPARSRARGVIVQRGHAPASSLSSAVTRPRPSFCGSGRRLRRGLRAARRSPPGWFRGKN